MKILIIGNGAREYSIAFYLLQDSRVQKVYFAPGNGATESLGENLVSTSYNDLLQIAQDLSITLVIVGSETPLVEGVTDLFIQAGFLVFGPSLRASLLEGSKVFMKEFVKRHRIPTAQFIQTDCIQKAMDFIHSIGYPIVIKADGLCAGKGVIIAQNEQEAYKALNDILNEKRFGDAGLRVVVEEYLDGFELSLFVISDSKNYILLPAAQDHKRLLDGDNGPNTGGMGAYAPSPLATQEILDKIEHSIVIPTLKGMEEENRAFKGVLFCGIMVVNNEPYVLEFNVRFGDPECQVILPLIKTPLLDILLSSAQGEGLEQLNVEFFDKYALCVVLATQEYPYSPPEPKFITFDSQHTSNHHSYLCYAGVARSGNKLLATGGRVMSCVGVGDNLQEAQKRAYTLCNMVSFEGKQFRSDIGFRVLK